MEEMFMRVFERSDALVAQVQQRADEYAQTLACRLLAAGHQPPDWLIPSSAAEPQELNGKPIIPGLVFNGRQITTPGANRTVFLPRAVPSTFFRNSEVPNGDNNYTAQHEEPCQEQTSLSQELAKSCAEVNMFSRIQRSKSRQKNIEDRLDGRDEPTKSGSCGGMTDGMHMSKLAGANKTTVSSSSIPCDDVENNAETTSSHPGQENLFSASQGMLVDLLKCQNDLGNQGVQLDCFPLLALENKVVGPHSDTEVGNNCSVRDMQSAPLSDHLALNAADSVCHIVPGSLFLVEPKKLQFDGADSVCIDVASEQTEQQQESASEDDHIDLSGREDPYPVSSAQEPHSIGRYPDLSGKHSLNEESSPTCSVDILDFMGDQMPQKDAQYVAETNSSERERSKARQPVETGTLNIDETNCSERSCFVVDLLLGKDKLQTSTEKPQNSDSNVSPPPYSGTLQPPTQIDNAGLGDHASSEMSPNSLLGEVGCGHLSNLLVNGTIRRSSQCMSDVSLEQLPPTSSNVYQSSLSHNRTQGNGNHSNGCAVVDAFESAENELPQDSYLSIRPVLEFSGSIADADAPFSHAPLGMQNEMLKGNPAFALDNSDSGTLGDDVQVNKTHDGSIDNINNESVVPKDRSSISSGRSREMQETQRNSMASSEKCTGSLQQGIEQETSPLENAVAINANVDTTDNVEQAKSSRPSVQYLLRSSVSHEKNNQLQAYNGNTEKRSLADGVQVNEGTSSKRKRIKCHDTIHSSSSGINSFPLNHQDGIGSHVVTAESFSRTSLPSGRYLLRGSGFSESMCLSSETKDAATNSNMSVTSDVPQNGNSSVKLRNKAKLSNVTLSNSSRGKALSPSFVCGGRSSAFEGMEFQNSEAQLQNNFDIAITSALDSCCKIGLDKECESEYPMGYVLSDATIPRQEGDESGNCYNTMPEFECFDVSPALDSPTTEKRTFETLCDSTQFAAFSSDISSKYKFNTVSGMHQLVASLSGKATSSSFDGDARYSASNEDRIRDIFGSCGLRNSGSFLPYDAVTSCSSHGSDKQVNGENPLTPAVEKGLGKLSARVGSVSEHTGSIPELSCFRIDEDSGIAEENEYEDILPDFADNQVQSGRKALQDITGLCGNTENSALYSIGFMDTGNKELTAETCSSDLNHHSDVRNDHHNKKPKENSSSIVKKEGKVSQSLLNRLSKTESIDNKNQRHMSEANLGKGSKPSNVVANVASFIPLVKPKQQSTTACGKKDVRVKALEAAEAAKRLEEKKQNEREMRKAAAKLEREKLKLEKESKQKQEQEQKKKRDTDVATRKRQRDEDERREKERKKKCVEETRKQQKQPMERRQAFDEKDTRPKASDKDNKEVQKKMGEAVKSQLNPIEMVDLGKKAMTSNNVKLGVVDERPASFGSHANENIPNDLEESYIMTPYKDSDDEEDDDEEASRRRRKFKPSWVREEKLAGILLSNQALDPREIFGRKSSFILSDVLPVHILQRGVK